jgi:hypothetical protein
LKEHEGNTAVIHCKAGKGRTGICIASLLLALGKSHTPNTALAQFAMSRTDNCLGVTIPSQRRWVQYYSQIQHLRSPPPPPPIDLISVGITGCPPKLTPRLIFVISQREYDKSEGFVSRSVITASMPKDRPQPGPSIQGLLCGVPMRMWTSDQPALPAPHMQKGAAFNASGTIPGQLVLAKRVHIGRGWRISQYDDSSISLDFDNDGTEVRPAPPAAVLPCAAAACRRCAQRSHAAWGSSRLSDVLRRCRRGSTCAACKGTSRWRCTRTA